MTPFILDDIGRIIPVNSQHPDLDWIADVQTAPNNKQYLPLLLASGLMYQALKAVRSDKRFRSLPASTQELITEALTCAE